MKLNLVYTESDPGEALGWDEVCPYDNDGELMDGVQSIFFLNLVFTPIAMIIGIIIGIIRCPVPESESVD